MTGRVGNRVEGSFIGGHNIQIGSVAGNVVLVLDRPAYRLELLTPVRTGRIPRSQRSPSHLLDAQREVVPYRPRPHDQETLLRWRDDEEPISVLLLHGQGGYGKTRLAGWFATDSHASQWTVLLGVDKPTPSTPAKSSQPDAVTEHPLLVVVDYADRWPLTTLVDLINNLVLDYPDQRIRVLLLARPQYGFWDDVSAQLARSGVDLHEPRPVRPFAPMAAEQEEAFADAVSAFQSTLEVDPEPIDIPAEVGADGDVSPLILHMTALATVCARQDGVAPPGPKQLSGYLFEHERRYWRAADLPAETVERIVFIASLLGPLPTVQARSWLRQAHLADGDAMAGRLLDAYDRLYPPLTAGTTAEPGEATQDAQDSALWPLKPDRFAEDFIAEHLIRPQASELLAEILTPKTPRELVRRGMIVLAAAARHPSARSALLNLLQAHPELAAHATAPVLSLVEEHADLSLAARVHEALPRYSTELLRPARDLAQRLCDNMTAETPKQLRAHYLSWLGIRLSEVGDKRAALEPTREAVDIRRRLAEAEPDAYLPDLAKSLWASAWVRNAHEIELSDGLRAVDEAIEIYAHLAAELPQAFNGYLQAARELRTKLLDQLNGDS